MGLRGFFGFMDGQRTERALGRAVYWALFATVVVLPLFFLPGVRYQVELPKAVLFSAIVAFVAVLYVLRLVIARRGMHVRTPFDWLVLAYVIFYGISFAASRSYYTSIVGIGGFFSSGVLITLCFVLFGYLIVQTVSRETDMLRFLWGFLVAISCAAVNMIFQAYEVYVLPWSVTHDYSFNLLAHSSTPPALLLALGIVLGMGMLLYHKKLWQQLCAAGFLIPMLAVVILLNKHVALYILMATAFAMLVALAFRSKALPVWWVFVPTCVVVIATIGIFIDTPKLLRASVSETVLLDQRTSALITAESVTHAPLWGSGPQTFAYDFARYRPISFNESSVWNLRFVKPSNEWFSVGAGVGIGGALALLAVAVWYMVWGVRIVSKEKRPGGFWVVRVSLVCSWFGILAVSFLTPFNFILQFAWWLLFALGIRAIRGKGMHETPYSLENPPYAAVAGTALFCLVVSGAVLVLFFGTRVVLADRAYVSAQDGIEQQGEIDSIFKNLERAIDLNPYEAAYHVSLAQGYVTKAQLSAIGSDTVTADIQALTQRALDELRVAASVAPDDSVVYEQQAQLYNSMRNLIGNIDDLSIQAYLKAAELEPTSPFVHLNLGRARLLAGQYRLQSGSENTQAQSEAVQYFDQALVDFSHAQELKRGFVEADFNIGLAYRLQGEFDKAAEEFLKVLRVEPRAIEARRQLASVYDAQGKLAEAIAELDALLNVEPDDNDAKTQRTQLRERLDAEDGDQGAE